MALSDLTFWSGAAQGLSKQVSGLLDAGLRIKMMQQQMQQRAFQNQLDRIFRRDENKLDRGLRQQDLTFRQEQATSKTAQREEDQLLDLALGLYQAGSEPGASPIDQALGAFARKKIMDTMGVSSGDLDKLINKKPKTKKKSANKDATKNLLSEARLSTLLAPGMAVPNELYRSLAGKGFLQDVLGRVGLDYLFEPEPDPRFKQNLLPHEAQVMK